MSLVWTSYKNANGSNKFTNETDMEVWNHKGFQRKNQIYCYAYKLYELYPMYDPRTYEMHRAIPTMLYTSIHNTSRCTGKWYLILRKVCTEAYIGRQVIACTVALQLVLGTDGQRSKEINVFQQPIQGNQAQQKFCEQPLIKRDQFPCFWPWAQNNVKLRTFTHSCFDHDSNCLLH